MWLLYSSSIYYRNLCYLNLSLPNYTQVTYNVFHFLSIVARGLILSNLLSEYTHSLAMIFGVGILLISNFKGSEN